MGCFYGEGVALRQAFDLGVAIPPAAIPPACSRTSAYPLLALSRRTHDTRDHGLVPLGRAVVHL